MTHGPPPDPDRAHFWSSRGPRFSPLLGCVAPMIVLVLVIVLAMSLRGDASEPLAGELVGDREWLQEGGLLRDLGGLREHVRFVNWDRDGGLSFRRRDGETLRRQASEIVRYGRGVYDRRGQGLLLVDGSWLAGRVTEINENECQVRGRYFNVSVPRPLVRATLLAAPAIDGLQEEMIREALLAVGSDDILIGVDGDRTSGALQPISQEAGEIAVVWQRGAGELSLLAGTQSLRVPAARVRAIVFSPLLTPLLTPLLGAAAETMVVGLADGTRLQVRRWTAGEERVTIELACGAEFAMPPRSWDAAAVVYLSPNQLDGAGRVVGAGRVDGAGPASARRLGDESPLRVRVQPLFGAAYDAPPQAPDRIRGADRPWGNRATVGGHWYGNTLSMSPASQAVYRGMADGGWLRAEVAIADPAKPDAALGSVRFRVLVATAEGALHEVWESELVRSGEGLAAVEVRIPPTAAVILAVEPAERGGAGDRAVWIDPVLTGP